MLSDSSASLVSYFLSKDTAATEIYTLSLHDALPICIDRSAKEPYTTVEVLESLEGLSFRGECVVVQRYGETNVDRKSTRLNSSHGYISYAVFCLKKKNNRLVNLNLRTNDDGYLPRRH